MSDDDDVESSLARVDLHAWRVPAPRAEDRASILERALTPPAARTRTRWAWVFAALAIGNAVLAALLVIALSRPPPAPTVVAPLGGGGAVDARTRQLLHRLEQDQRALERQLADVQQLRTAVEELSERVRQCESNPRRPARTPIDPGACDEVSCVLTHGKGACCAKLRSRTTTTPPARALPETLDRRAITAGIATVRARATACGRPDTKGTVTVRVRVAPSGRPESVLVDPPPDPALLDVSACVADAMLKATFERTHHGGSFNYPFVFGAF